MLPRGELHEYENGPARTMLFRARSGIDMSTLIKQWRGNPAWRPKPEDVARFGFRWEALGRAATRVYHSGQKHFTREKPYASGRRHR